MPSFRFDDNSKGIKKLMQKEADRRVMKAGMVLRDETLKVLSNQPPRTGKIGIVPRSSARKVKSSAKAVTYIMSAPGEPPALRTGNFRSTIGLSYKRLMNLSGDLAAMVGTADKRGVEFQHGRHGMQPRPWLTIALQRAQTKMKNIMMNG